MFILIRTLIISITSFFFPILDIGARDTSKALILTDQVGHYDLSKNLDIFEDSTGKLSIKDILKPSWQDKFEKRSGKKLNFGYSKSTFWARLKLQNKSIDQKVWLLSHNYYLQDEIEVFKNLGKGKWVGFKTGDTFPFASREVEARSFTFKIKPTTESVYYVKIKGTANQMDLSISSPIQFAKNQTKDNYILGLFFGLVLSMIFYNAFIFISTKELSYLFYVLHVASYGLGLSLYQGFSQRFLFPNFPIMSNNGITVLIGLMGFFLYLFTIKFLKLDEEMPKIYRFLIFLSIFCLALVPSAFFFDYSFNLKYQSINGFTFSVVILVIGFYRVFYYRPAIYFFMAFLCTLIGSIVMGLMTTGILPSIFIVKQAPIIGNALELILLSLGLADKFNLMKEQAYEKEAEAKKVLKNHAVSLHKKVLEKTDELKKEKDALKIVLEETSRQKKSRDQLLGSLGQGYLTFNSEGIIQEGTTKITENLLETHLLKDSPDGLKIWDVLFKDQPEKNTTFKSWVKNVFEGKIQFRDLNQLAPKIFEGQHDKYIELEFRPIFNEDENKGLEVDKLILIASDKTNELELKKQLEIDKEKTDFVTSCLGSPAEFVDLLDDTYQFLDSYYEGRENKPETLFRTFHTFKARYSQYGLRSITHLLNTIETTISENNLDPLESDVKKFEFQLKSFLKENRLIVEAANRFLADEGSTVQISDIINNTEGYKIDKNYMNLLMKNYLLTDIKKKFEKYRPLIFELASKQGKKVDLHIYGDEIKVDEKKYSDFIKNTIHLFRNMVDHGIEPEKERINLTKDEVGKIEIDFRLKSDSFIVKFFDDGSGINPESIKGKLIEKGLKREEDLEDINQQSLVEMIFMPGFSTKEELTDVSGRGVGLDAVKTEVEKLGGSISVHSRVGEGTLFVIELPLLN